MFDYLDLLARSLTGMLYEDPPVDPWHGILKDSAGRVISPDDATAGSYTVEPGVYDPAVRETGRDWPKTAPTMIGLRRLAALRQQIEDVVSSNIPGDLLETGVWRGGACIFMRAALEFYGDRTRRVLAADSFRGFPENANDPHSGFGLLAVSLADVRENFERYGLLDDRVIFLEGWFSETLPGPIDKLALLRLDGDTYQATTDVLTACYDRLSSRGYCVIDDFNLPPVAQAVRDFVKVRSPHVDPHVIDRNGIFWRKGE